MIVAAVSIVATSFFWTLTDFWRPTRTVNVTEDFDERMKIYNAYIEHEESLRLEFEERKKELAEEFNEPISDKELCKGLDVLLDLKECQ